VAEEDQQIGILDGAGAPAGLIWGRRLVGRPATTSTPGSARRIDGDAMTFTKATATQDDARAP
jgi:hypothetical protein